MANDPKTDLIYAILAMDSYNRGYGSGIKDLIVPDFDENGNPINTVKVGNFSITRQSNTSLTSAAFTAGFYAIAYKKGTGASAETVISYRGTDDNIGGDKTGGSDARYGYGIALGATPDGSFNFGTDQARLAAQFYESVTDKSDTQADANVVLTGHSLGGGLAGYVGVTSGTRAVLFDHLPFDVSGLIRANQLNVTPQWNQMHGYFTEGEFLQATRNGALQTILGALSVLIPVAGPVVAAILAPYGGSLGGATAALEANIAKTSLHSNANLLNPFSQYHSMALLTALQWNEAYGDKTWVPAAQELWQAFFDDAVADSIPEVATRTDTATTGKIGSTLRTAIAYSAISEGDDAAKPFGDTAIGAMFNDAGDLGRVLGRADVPQVIRDAAAGLGQMLVQYAGKLALGDVETAQDDAAVTEGILTASPDGGLLSVDMSDARWSHGAATANLFNKAAGNDNIRVQRTAA